MKIDINNQPVEIPDDISDVESLMLWRKIPTIGTAVALNGKLVPHSKWKDTTLKDNDAIVVISAAYGG